MNEGHMDSIPTRPPTFEEVAGRTDLHFDGAQAAVEQTGYFSNRQRIAIAVLSATLLVLASQNNKRQHIPGDETNVPGGLSDLLVDGDMESGAGANDICPPESSNAVLLDTDGYMYPVCDAGASNYLVIAEQGVQYDPAQAQLIANDIESVWPEEDGEGAVLVSEDRCDLIVYRDHPENAPRGSGWSWSIPETFGCEEYYPSNTSIATSTIESTIAPEVPATLEVLVPNSASV